MASTSTVISYLFMYSIAMFTLPFAAFFGTRRFLTEYLDVKDFKETIFSVLAAVIVVHIVIALYVRHAVAEMRADNEFAPSQLDHSKSD
uniref:Unkown protein n=1 Tax=Riptortus pedestris TaxID=329032 RepID=R4WE57_RIPPE|nr:unkown protein [Riptortus pedestris]